MDIKTLLAKLHPLEIKVLAKLTHHTTHKELVNATELQEVEVMRAMQWLQNKKIITMQVIKQQIIDIGPNGELYKEKGLPEIRFLKNTAKDTPIAKVMEEAHIKKDEINICLGMLKQRGAILIKKEKGLLISITSQGKKLLEKKSLEEQFLEKTFPLIKEELKPEEQFAAKALLQRKEILIEKVVKTVIGELTDLGKQATKQKSVAKLPVDRLTPTMLKDGSWKKANFRAYDVKINVPSIFGGKRHFVNQAIAYARRIWMDMGFQEMEGPLLNTSFWNFDALFTAQDHPVRELQDTYYISQPAKGRLPDKKLISAVKEAHEKGGTTGSLGWRYKWDPEEAKKLVLRTHTTVLSAQTLAKLKEADLPAKFFSFGRCFRNETVDWSHLFEFNQTDGIVVDPDANFRNLLGYLKQFFKKMGFPEARFRPAFFPYTEPSVEIDVYHPVHKEWIELGGAGVFRPEVVKPLLGKDIPVLAWGPGFDRMILDYYKITDMRELYKNDIKQLREMKTWLK